MKIRELRSCDACKRATRDWHPVTLSIDGRKALNVTVCQRCSSDIEDAARRALRDAAPVPA